MADIEGGCSATTEGGIMREIKFRAWHKKRQTMCHFDIMTITKTYYPGYWHTVDLDGFDCELDDPNLYTDLMQYTGLKDKNGAEIYEGDIVNLTCSCGYIEAGSVEWGYNGYRIATKYQHDWDSSCRNLAWCRTNVEVIGNIYENPELLTQLEPIRNG